MLIFLIYVVSHVLIIYVFIICLEACCKQFVKKIVLTGYQIYCLRANTI